MNRLLSLSFVFALGASSAFAQFKQPSPKDQTVTVWTEVAISKVQNPDGTYSVSRGAPIKVTIKPIELNPSKGRDKNPFGPPPSPPEWLAGRSPLFNTTVYQNDTGSFFVAEEGPSCLDDLVILPSGNNKAWKIVDFGVFLTNASRTGEFLVRWRGFSTYVADQGAGVMAFTNSQFDFGFYLDRADFPPGPATGQAYLVTADISLNPLAIVPNQVCYFAQQFRQPHPGGPLFENGEGPFTNVWNVFANNGPQIGASQDQFVFDFPADGIYDETEWDQFDANEGGAGAGSFLLKVQVGSGNTTTVNPFTFNWFRGVLLSGSIGSLWFSDNTYNVARSGLVLFPGEAPAQLIVESFSPTFTPAGIRVDAEARANTPGLTMTIDMWNFVTSSWQTTGSAPVGTTDSLLQGFTPTPVQCVQAGTGIVRAKLSFRRTGLTLVYPWTVSVDQLNWTISTP